MHFFIANQAMEMLVAWQKGEERNYCIDLDYIHGCSQRHSISNINQAIYQGFSELVM